MEEAYALAYRDLFERHWWWRARERVILDVLRGLPAKTGRRRILDVGCGDGLFFSALERFGDVEGVESDARLVTVQGPRRARIHVGPFDETFAPEAAYDWILMLDVLEHLDDPRAALAKALGLLAPGGRLVITVPAFMALWTAHDDWNQHRARFTRGTFRALAREAGMRVDGMRYFFYWTALAKLLVRLKERLAPGAPAPETVPPTGLNRLLYGLSRLEEWALGRVPIPFGSSLLIVGGRDA
ncbi:MAG: class I SAM-dependent methyltransferase [Myxococcales bacterium]|nr:class I SAM-dependent methyltransferase [Myxococcales bacterium]